jgi:hypothetical protein
LLTQLGQSYLSREPDPLKQFFIPLRLVGRSSQRDGLRWHHLISVNDGQAAQPEISSLGESHRITG